MPPAWTTLSKSWLLLSSTDSYLPSRKTIALISPLTSVGPSWWLQATVSDTQEISTLWGGAPAPLTQHIYNQTHPQPVMVLLSPLPFLPSVPHPSGEM